MWHQHKLLFKILQPDLVQKNRLKILQKLANITLKIAKIAGNIILLALVSHSKKNFNAELEHALRFNGINSLSSRIL